MDKKHRLGADYHPDYHDALGTLRFIPLFFGFVATILHIHTCVRFLGMLSYVSR